MIIQEQYKAALRFAAQAHDGQLLPGTDMPYLVHVASVATEVIVAGFHTPVFDTTFAAQVALLHDTMEDTGCTFKDIQMAFGLEIANAVLALTKFSNLPKAERIPDSLQRIRQMQKEVWAVKLADRISNLDAPPLEWDYAKRRRYMDGAVFILESLRGGNDYLSKRLEQKIRDYEQYVVSGDK
jgi:guanosine-3',5'-bis(diphosphate) 3'-pyrophosphohydrolase